MTSPIKKLVAVEFAIDKEDMCNFPFRLTSIVVFRDPETGLIYWPRSGFQVSGNLLNELFVEIEPVED